MKVAYLINQYPHASHSFIRREIAALEGLGVSIQRFTIRPSSNPLVDPADREEQKRTQVLLDAGIMGLLSAWISTALARPRRWWWATRTALQMGYRSDRGILRHLAYVAEACLLDDRLRRSGVTHLHAHFGTNSAAVALLTHLLGGVPFSFTVHGPEEFARGPSLSIRDKIEHAAFVVAISDFGWNELCRWCSAEHWPKIHVVRCGVDGRFLESGPQPVPDRNRILFVGRLAPEKGLLDLIHALGRLAAEGVSFEMVLIGDGPMRGVIEEQCQQLDLSSHVRLTGWLTNEEVRVQMLAARLLVLPSSAEGLPVVLMEAMALGRAVLTTPVAGIPELVEEGVNGWLVPVGSSEALAQSLRRALETPIERLEQMGRAGAARVAQMHDAKQEAAKLARIIRN